MTTKSPPTKKNSRTKLKVSTLFSTAVRSPRGRGGETQLQNFPKGAEQLIFNHDHRKDKDYDHLYEDFECKDQTQSKTSKNASKRCVYDSTVSGKITYLYGKGQICEEFDRISGIVGTPTIKEHSKGELTESYFNGEALHFYSVNIIDLCYHIIGNVLGRYMRISVRENAKKLATTNLNQTTYENEDCRFNKDENISQEHLLQHFITAVVVFNPVWVLEEWEASPFSTSVFIVIM